MWGTLLLGRTIPNGPMQSHHSVFYLRIGVGTRCGVNFFTVSCTLPIDDERKELNTGSCDFFLFTCMPLDGVQLLSKAEIHPRGANPVLCFMHHVHGCFFLSSCG